MPNPRRPAARSIFLNCPFDEQYKAHFTALIFAVHDCGFYARCALEISDSGQSRFEKICQLTRECRCGIHDLSRTSLDPITHLPRFNMPLELGLFLGARVFASRRRPSSKVCLVMDTEQYRYRDFCSDLAGFDIEGHNGESLQIVRVVRNWLRTNQVEQENIPSGIHIFDRYNQFLEELPELCRPDHLDPNALIFPEYVSLVEAWLLEHAFAVSYWMLRFDPTRIVVTVLSTPLDQS